MAPQRFQPRIRRALAAWHKWVFDRRFALAVLASLLILLIIGVQVSDNWTDLKSADWLMVSGFPVGLIFLCSTLGVQRRFEDMIETLSDRSVLRFMEPCDGVARPVEEEDRRRKLRDEAKSQIEESASVWGVIVSLIVGALCLFITIRLLKFNFGSLAQPLLICATVTLMSLGCGLRLGRMACYGWQGLRYKDLNVGGQRLAVRPQLGHPDGSSGLAPVGGFYRFQIGTMSWLIVYAVTWLLILQFAEALPFVRNGRLSEIQFVLFALFLVFFALQVFGFILPMVSIHVELKLFQSQQKEQAESRYYELADVREKLDMAPDAVGMDRALQAIFLRNHYEDLRTMRRWPAAFGTMFNFWLGRLLGGGIAVAAFFGDLPSVVNFFAGIIGPNSGI